MRYSDMIAGADPWKSTTVERSSPDNALALSVKDLGKLYRVYHSAGQKLKEIISCGLLSCHTKLWALDKVSFDVARGETLGIVGKNGSGKSTLLQIICGTVAPATGTVEYWGKVAGLLELGAGFHPEFTGRENVYMYGAVLGLSKAEIDERFNDIVDFSEMSDFIDQPVKNYSSGMFVRLAFSTAINVDPDILVVDEALAVGDALFQAKCFRKFHEIQAQGRTILFVTHSEEQLTRLCSRAMVMEQGKNVFQGSAKDALNIYRDLLWGVGHRRGHSSNIDIKGRSIWPVRMVKERPENSGCSATNQLDEFFGDTRTDDNFPNRRSYNPDEYRCGDQKGRLVDYLLVSDGKYDGMRFDSNKRLDVYVKSYFEEDVENVVMGFIVQTLEGVFVFGYNTREAFIGISGQKRNGFLVTKFSLLPRLISGNYLITLGMARQDPTGAAWGVDRRYNVLVLEVNNCSRASGIADLQMSIDVEVSGSRVAAPI